MSYRQILYHIVFRTKYSDDTINQEHAKELYKYIWGVIKDKKCVLFQINGIENHIHILSDLNPTIAFSDYIKDIKISSSIWMKSSGLFPDFIGWSSQYCAITYSYRKRDMIINYIKNQQEHHKKESFKKEVEKLFEEQNISEDLKWFLKDS